jgi:L-ascorbate metabolism protein UlaG (beta-lactamase superfamily)
MFKLTFLVIFTYLQAYSAVSFRWSGVSGFILSDEKTTLYFDPNLTMVRLWDWLPFQKVESDIKTVKFWTDKCELLKVDAVIINHSHTDHILDAPSILKEFGGEFYGSNSSSNYIRGMGISEKRIHEIDFKDEFTVGDFKIKVIKVVHPPHLFNFMLARGKIEKPLKTPASPWEFKLGKTFSFYITHPKGRVLFSSVATLPTPDPLKGIEADVMLATIAKRGDSRNFIQKRVMPVKAKINIALHYDDFFNPLPEDGIPRPLPFVDPDEYFKTAEKMLGKEKVVKLNYCERIDLF